MAYRILLSKLLGEARWTQADLARSTGISAPRINEIYWDIEIGRVTLDQVDLICDALGCSLCDLVELKPNTVSRTKMRNGRPKPENPERT